MPEIDKRLRYFDGQFLQAVDFNAEQEYHLDRLRRQTRLLFSYGIAEGLALTVSQDKTTVSISPGTAIDGLGRQIVLTSNVQISLQGQPSFQGQTLLAVVGYAEAPSDQANVGLQDFTRFVETPDVQLVIDNGSAPPADQYLRIARITVSNGSLTVTGTPDESVRVVAGAKLPNNVPIQNLQLSNPQLSPADWPVLSADGKQSAVLTGVLSVDDLIANKDVSFLDHVKDQGNPHGTTAAQLGVPVSVGGVSNPGGSIAVVGSGGISVGSDNISKRITLTVGAPNSITGITNAGGDIALVAGNTGLAVVGDQSNKRILLTPNAPATLHGVSNPAGNISLASGGSIVITPDNSANKRITISESHSALTGNPHATLASQLADYDMGRRFFGTLLYTSSNADGFTVTFNLGFQARTVWTSGCATATFGGGSFGGVISGFADLRSTPVNNGYGPLVTRQTGNPTLVVSAINGTNTNPAYIAKAFFQDLTVSPTSTADLGVRISSVTSTSLTLTFDRTGTMSTFAVQLSILMVG